MKKNFYAAAVAVAFFATGAEAATLKLEGYTAPIQTVNVSASPVAGTKSTVGGTAFNMLDLSGSLGSFVAWCLDIGHQMMSKGSSAEYVVTDDPYSNSFSLSDKGRDRVQALFDANYADLDLSNGDQAAAFQMALWESAYEADSAATSMTDGLFEASSAGSNTLANNFLLNALGYTGGKRYEVTFLEIAGLGPDRAYGTGQNLVTVSEVPLPAAGALLLTALAGTAFVGRRRKNV